MLRTLFVLVSLLSTSGCASLAESIIDSVGQAIFPEKDVDPQILRRKGIEPGSKEHRRLAAEMKAQREFIPRMK